MTERGRDIIKMMGYEDMDAFLHALGHGDVIAIKVPPEHHERSALWIHSHIDEIPMTDEMLSTILSDIAESLELAHELSHYPVSADICEIHLPHGWPSYCDRKNL